MDVELFVIRELGIYNTVQVSPLILHILGQESSLNLCLVQDSTD
jgi:hypothetical protein